MLPLPNSPLLFAPQQKTLPSLLTAEECGKPADMKDMSVKPTDFTGVALKPSNLPFPS
jgi:hypothetical protein